MRIRIRPLSLIFKFATAAVAALAVILDSGILTMSITPASLLYFTVTVDVLTVFCFLRCGFGALGDSRDERDDPDGGLGLKHALIVAVVASAILPRLAPAYFGGFVPALSAAPLMTVCVPAMVVLDWLLFERKGRTHVASPVLWLTLPLVYAVAVVALVLLCARYAAIVPVALTGYPYAFMSYSTIGVAAMIPPVLMAAAVFLVVGYAFFAADHALALGSRRSNPARKRDSVWRRPLSSNGHHGSHSARAQGDQPQSQRQAYDQAYQQQPASNQQAYAQAQAAPNQQAYAQAQAAPNQQAYQQQPFGYQNQAQPKDAPYAGVAPGGTMRMPTDSAYPYNAPRCYAASQSARRSYGNAYYDD